jgi:hypothetical protein
LSRLAAMISIEPMMWRAEQLCDRRIQKSCSAVAPYVPRSRGIPLPLVGAPLRTQ